MVFMVCVWGASDLNQHVQMGGKWISIVCILGCFRLRSARLDGNVMDIHCAQFGMLQTQISTFKWKGCFRTISARLDGKVMDIHCVHFGMLQTQISTFKCEGNGYPLCAFWDASDSNQHV